MQQARGSADIQQTRGSFPDLLPQTVANMPVSACSMFVSSLTNASDSVPYSHFRCPREILQLWVGCTAVAGKQVLK